MKLAPRRTDARSSASVPAAAPARASGSLRLQLRELGYAAGAERLAPDEGVASAGLAGGGPLPHLDVIQAAFGRHDVSGVRATVGGPAAAACGDMGASGYAMGSQVAFAEAPSLHLAAHEAAHVVQQRAGVSLSGGVGAVGDRYERHADEVAEAVVGGRSAEGILDRMAGGGAGGAGSVAIQRFVDPRILAQARTRTDPRLQRALQYAATNDTIRITLSADGQTVQMFEADREGRMPERPTRQMSLEDFWRWAESERADACERTEYDQAQDVCGAVRGLNHLPVEEVRAHVRTMTVAELVRELSSEGPEWRRADRERRPIVQAELQRRVSGGEVTQAEVTGQLRAVEARDRVQHLEAWGRQVRELLQTKTVAALQRWYTFKNVAGVEQVRQLFARDGAEEALAGAFAGLLGPSISGSIVIACAIPPPFNFAVALTVGAIVGAVRGAHGAAAANAAVLTFEQAFGAVARTADTNASALAALIIGQTFDVAFDAGRDLGAVDQARADALIDDDEHVAVQNRLDHAQAVLNAAADAARGLDTSTITALQAAERSMNATDQEAGAQSWTFERHYPRYRGTLVPRSEDRRWFKAVRCTRWAQPDCDTTHRWYHGLAFVGWARTEAEADALDDTRARARALAAAPRITGFGPVVGRAEQAPVEDYQAPRVQDELQANPPLVTEGRICARDRAT